MATGESVRCKDGRIGINIGPWAKDKLHYINRYCDIFNSGMKNRWPIRAYIDLFSGPGIGIIDKTNEEIAGSPLLALRCSPPFTHYYFNDSEPEYIQALKEYSKEREGVTTEFFSEDCNSVVNKLITRLPAKSLDFCFIDPLNFEINFDSIRRLTAGRRMDLAITFHIGAIKRIANTPTPELNSFFPNDTWQGDYQKARASGKSEWHSLLNSYKNGLIEIGYHEIKDYVLEKNSKEVPLYHLIFASKNSKGAQFWDKIAFQNEMGQKRMQLIYD